MIDYADAAMVPCPRCRARVGKPCAERACRHGRRNCDYAICSYWKDLPEPHLERVVAARRVEKKPSGGILVSDTVRAWRLSIEACNNAGGVRLGEFNWPWALGLALDALDGANTEIARLQAIVGHPATQGELQ